MEDGGVNGRVEPAFGSSCELGVNRQPRGKGQSSRLGGRLKLEKCRPRPLGVDVVRGHGRHAAPVVDPRFEYCAEVGHEIGGSL